MIRKIVNVCRIIVVLYWVILGAKAFTPVLINLYDPTPEVQLYDLGNGIAAGNDGGIYFRKDNNDRVLLNHYHGEDPVPPNELDI